MFAGSALIVADELYPAVPFLGLAVEIVLMVYSAVFVGLILYFCWRGWVKTQPVDS